MKTLAAALCAALALPAAAAEVTPDALTHLPPADVVILGEVHDNPTHHANQAAAVAALKPRALVFEMLTPEQAARATAKVRGNEAALAKALGWAGSGWPDFKLYYPIFAAAPQAKIYGAALPVAQVRRAVKEGAAKVFGPGADRYGLTTPLPAAQQQTREANQQRDHCNALPDSLLGGMVAAQRLRDAAFARTIVQAMKETGGPVAMITGSGHARRDWGIPAALALAVPDLTVLSIGQLEAPADAQEPFDLWLVTPPTPREDPCKAFRNSQMPKG
ncbi:ChaN family lipoprotein [Acidimangrovimonas pyrenivorans]|uniref:ChaN family lipoprotein n=1 Tax=Acidimangrovimonas pyrenivorans TaxID=2030798 RepID=A0ABV7AL35_9RHOB